MIVIEEGQKPIDVSKIGHARSNKMYLSSRQFDVLNIICEGDGKDAAGKLIPVDLDELLDRLAIPTTKQSMQFTIRLLIEKGMIEKGEPELRRKARRRVFFPTALGRAIAGDDSGGHFVTTDYGY